MPLHPQAKAVLDAFAANMPPIGSLSPQEMRNAMRFPAPPGPPVYLTRQHYVASPLGAVTIRVYTPVGRGPFPALVWFHGGGWVAGTVDQSDGNCRHLCNNVGCVVVSVDYRLAPENKFPAAAEDCYAVTAWAARNPDFLSIDPTKIAVGGDSAGGNLAAVVPLMARDRGGPRLACQLLIYPVTDYNFNTRSYQENANGYLLTKDSMVWFWNHYLTGQADAKNPYAAPMQAKDLKGLPPALIITAEFDPLRDEGEAYGQRLKQAGVSATISRYDGMIHGFFGNPAIDRGRDAVREASEALKSAFSQAAPAPAGRR